MTSDPIPDHDEVEWGGGFALLFPGHGVSRETINRALDIYGCEPENYETVEENIWRKVPDPSGNYAWLLRRSKPGRGAFKATLVSE